jgi:hypothetical protein
MEKMLTAEEFLKLWKDEDCAYSGEPEGWEVVEETDWTQDHKYQYQETTYHKDGQYFSVTQSRSGSYHTDWYYNDPECFEVERHEEVKVVVTYKLKK